MTRNKMATGVFFCVLAFLGIWRGLAVAKNTTFAVDPVSSPAGPGSAEPNLAVGPDGRVYMSWLEPADSGHALRFSVHDGSVWAPARTIAAATLFTCNPGC